MATVIESFREELEARLANLKARNRIAEALERAAAKIFGWH